MKVLYDISVLGLGHRSAKARTGVFRVVENVADELVKRNDLTVSFSSDFESDSVEACKDYLATKDGFNSTRFEIPQTVKNKIAAKKRWNKLVEIEQTKDISLVQKFPLKVRVRTNDFAIRLNDRLSRSRQVAEAFYGKCDIYHSTFFPVSSNIDQKKTKSFLTSYDIIPILFPEYADAQIADLIKKVAASITPDTWVLCISEATRSDLLNYVGTNADPQKVIVTELAASDTFYQSEDKEANRIVRKKYNIPDSPYVLSLCTLEPRKNIDQVIRAFVQMCRQERIQDLNLVLVGTKGWMFDKIFEELEANHDIKNRIIITGFVDDADLAALYSDASMFVYPSFYEGFGLPPLEAMKCGVPVITSNTSSLPEVVGDAGIMVGPTDLDALCSAMLAIYKSETLREEMSSKSIARAKKFSWERCADETVEAYKLSLGSN